MIWSQSVLVSPNYDQPGLSGSQLPLPPFIWDPYDYWVASTHTHTPTHTHSHTHTHTLTHTHIDSNNEQISFCQLITLSVCYHQLKMNMLLNWMSFTWTLIIKQLDSITLSVGYNQLMMKYLTWIKTMIAMLIFRST